MNFTCTFSDLSSTFKLLISGHKSGLVHLFDVSDLNEANITTTPPRILLQPCDVPGFFPFILAKQIQSVFAMSVNPFKGLNDKKGELIVCVSTRGCDIVEVRVTLADRKCSILSENDGVLMRAHCNDELWGLATHPCKPEFCTVGDDKTMVLKNLP